MGVSLSSTHRFAGERLWKSIRSHYTTALKITKRPLYSLALYKITCFICAWGAGASAELVEVAFKSFHRVWSIQTLIVLLFFTCPALPQMMISPIGTAVSGNLH